MQHVTEFRPAIFMDLASDWEALTYWNLTDGVGDQNIIDSFGESHVEVIMFNSLMYSDFFPTSIKVTTDMADFLNETRSSNNTELNKIYQTRNARKQSSNKFVMYNEKFRDEHAHLISEPNVT